MQLPEILQQEMIVAHAQARAKYDLIRLIAERLATHAAVTTDAEHIHAALMNRESLGSTGVGEGVAIPHAKIAGLSRLIACFVRAPDGVPFEAIDGNPATLIFALLVPENSAGAHLKALARVSRLMKNRSFREHLLHQETATGLYEALLHEDSNG